ncbi:MAG: M56 family metallopeptidase [Planctomycetaceae bacterium]
MSAYSWSDWLFATPLPGELVLRLTFALLHFLWQGVLIGLLTVGVAWIFRSKSARSRYGINFAGLVALAICMPVTFAIVQIPEVSTSRSTSPVQTVAPFEISSQVKLPTPADVDLPPAVMPSLEAQTASTPPGTVAAAPHEQPSTFPMTVAWSITAVYIFGVCLMLLRLTVSLWGGQRLRIASAAVTDASLLQLVSRQAREIGLKSAPAIAWCERTAVPMVVGIIRPLVLLPASLSTGLDSSQLAAIISHELAHIRRFDLVVNLFQRIVESLLFFHPAVWWISRRVSRERELCCDDLVIQSGCGQLQYVDALIRMAELCTERHPSLVPQVAALRASGDSRSDLSRRVYRLLGATDTPKVQRLRSSTLLVLGACAAITVVLMVQYGSRSAAANKDERSGVASLSEDFERNAASGTVDESVSGADHADQKAADRLDSLYQLRENQVLKWIPLEQTDESSVDPAIGPSTHYYEQEGTTVNLKTRDFGGPSSLFNVVHTLLHVPTCDLTGDVPIWMTNITGDFVIRKDASQESLLNALNHVLGRDMKLQASLRWVQQESDVWVVSGKFKPDPIGEPWRLPKEENRAYAIYGRSRSEETPRGASNVGSFDDLLTTFGSRTGLPVINELETTPPGYFGWETFLEDSEQTVWNEFPRHLAKNVDLVAQHLQEQTGLKVCKERRQVSLLRASNEVAPLEQAPTSSTGEPDSESSAPDRDFSTDGESSESKGDAERESNDGRPQTRKDANDRATISGRIVMEDGSPATVKGWMYYHSQSGNNSHQGTVNQFTDRFTFPAPAGTIWLSYFPDEHAPTWAGQFELKPGEHKEDVTLVLQAGDSRLVKVTDEKGEPVANATLVAHPEIFGNVSGPVRELTTDSNGEYRLEHLADTRYAFRLHAPGYQPLRSEPLDIEPDEVLQFTMQRSEPCTGVVRTADGAPAAGVQLRMKYEVRANPPSGDAKGGGDGWWGQPVATTDDQGRFTLDELSSGSQYLFVVEASDGTRAITDTLQAGKQDVQITLPQRHDLTVTVTVTGNTDKLRQRRGKPYVSLRQRVLWHRPNGGSIGELLGEDFPIIVTEAGGTATFRGLAVDLRPDADRQQVEVSLGNDRQTMKTVELNQAGATHVEFDLTDGTEISSGTHPLRKQIFQSARRTRSPPLVAITPRSGFILQTMSILCCTTPVSCKPV